jgi:hypothetical protein
MNSIQILIFSASTDQFKNTRANVENDIEMENIGPNGLNT